MNVSPLSCALSFLANGQEDYKDFTRPAESLQLPWRRGVGTKCRRADCLGEAISGGEGHFRCGAGRWRR
jgi:hypothetical protein